MEFIFFVFAFLLLMAAVFTISSRNAVYAVLWLIFALLNASGLFLLLGAEYIAMTLVIVYVGAVAVLFLFVVMMLDIEHIVYKLSAKHFILALLVFVSIAGFLIYTFNISSPFVIDKVPKVSMWDNTTAIGAVMYTDYIVAFQLCGVVLFISMIGAIVLTLRHKKDVKRQSIYKQLQRNKANSLELNDVQFRQGIK